ncbi:DVU_1556 family methyltransferase [Oceanidesulfovibrio indonesiensis]|uniref:DVU_1556 family methyltransferase n=1 Tax=Oceanidesulfovibrio indonesiensis TaxID=54767 RepID=UPI001430DDC0|nr:methyltransferase domain-containing protein [Oceanidesulfovibrio indonesiensis]
MSATAQDAAAPYLRRDVQEALGGALRPGGFAATERALELHPLRPGFRVLDVGCGLGSSVAMLRERYGLRAFGIDASSAILAQSEGTSSLLCATAEAIPFRNGSLDGVFFECSLSLCPDHRAVLAEAVRALAPGGMLVVSDIYCRRDKAADRPHASGCLRGALSRGDLLKSLSLAGLTILAWEDHSRLLADCAARLAFAGVPASAFFGSCGDKGYCGFAAREFGYSLCIAEKTSADTEQFVENI